MLTHLVKSINWIDVAFVIFFVRMVFIGVKNGFLSEFFRFLGVVTAVFVSIHFYSFLASWTASRTHVSWDYWGLVIFAILWCAVALFFKLLRDGILVLFKAETTHQGFDRYAAGAVAVGRGLLVCSLAIFLIFLTRNGPLMRMALHSYSYKVAGSAALSTYGFLFTNLVDKLFTGEHYNENAPKVLHPEGK